MNGVKILVRALVVSQLIAIVSIIRQYVIAITVILEIRSQGAIQFQVRKIRKIKWILTKHAVKAY